jgi:hypothetical protein
MYKKSRDSLLVYTITTSGSSQPNVYEISKSINPKSYNKLNDKLKDL